MIEGKLNKGLSYYCFCHRVKPGVTRWAQVNYRYGYTHEDTLIKLKYDLFYINNRGF